MIKVAIVSDSHFDTSSRFEECVRIHDWIAGDIKKRGVQLLLHAGDVFERKSNPVERIAFAEWVTKVSGTCPVVIVRGNHDAVGDLEIFGRLETMYPVTVVETARVVQVAVPGEGEHYVNVAAVAWPRKAELLARLDDEHSSHEASEILASEILANVIRGLGDEMIDEEGPKILLMHAMVDGAVTSTGQPLVGCDMNIGLEDLGLARADFYALGHIHKGQEWTYNGKPIAYPGSPRRTAFGEIEEKGYILVEFEPQYYGGPQMLEGEPPRTMWEAKWSRIPTPCTPMLLFECVYDPDHESGFSYEGGPFMPDVAVACAGKDQKPEMRFRYRVIADQREAAREAAKTVVAALRMCGAVDVKVEEVVIPTTKARAPEISKVQTLGEKLLVLWRVRNEVPDEPRGHVLLSMLAQVEQEARDAT